MSARNRTRSSPRRRAPNSFSRLSIAAALVILIIVAAGVGFMGARGGSGVVEEPPASQPNAEQPGAIPSTGTVSAVEVPDLVGFTLGEALSVLEGARLEASGTDGVDKSAIVVAQKPLAGALVTAASAVALSMEPRADQGAGDPSEWVVCIDPGHQRRSNMKPEPVGPKSKETKPSVTGGTQGIETKLPEYEVALQISMNLKARLEKAGVTVVMTRTTNDVDISNSERAAIANDADADLFVRVHCDGSPDNSRSGISTLYPGKNKWTTGIAGPSKDAANKVQSALVGKTGAKDLGIVERDDITGFNYAKMPSVLVECGFMSNPVEDRLLASPHYQDKLAEGMQQGILAFLGSL
jgi:N-acetylmuramoyl-L-alanine amidase